MRLSWRHFDFWLLGAVAILTIFGITMIRSAIAENIELLELDVVRRQLIFAVAGFAVILITAAVDYHLWSSISRLLYIFVAAFLILVSLTAGERFGAVRWLEVGTILIQPSELAKIAAILVLADFFARHKEKISDLRWVVRSLLLTLGLVVLILLQPDLSTSIVIMVIWFALLWASGLRIKHVLSFTGIGAMVIGVGLPILLLNFDPTNVEGLIKPYQVRRVVNFLFPDEEARYGETYNVEQALISIGTGEWTGKGYDAGSQVQLRFLKVRHVDFIFAALSEEFGFVGALIVMLLLFFVIWRCLRAARLARDTFGALIAYGVATLIAFQTIINIGMNLNLLPVTGLPLPFISYGGSSLLTTLMGIGLVESVILRHKALDF